MQEWRKTTDSNLKLKDDRISELQSKFQKSDKELQRLKAENQMLRRNQKEWLGSTTKQIEDERNGIQERLRELESERESRELEWLREKERMKEKIEELEETVAERKGEGLLARHLKVEEAVEETMDGGTERQSEGSKEMQEVLVKNRKLKKKLQQKDDR